MSIALTQKQREETWSQIDREWDVIIIGGGITGAGILREAARLDLKTILVEQRDFAWGTSSRSSKLVHGGLRYLKEGAIRLTQASVQERERLLTEAPGLVEQLGFLLATYKGDRPGRWTYQAGLSVYDLLALQWSHQYYSAEDFRMLAPRIAQEGLEGGFRYNDAQTDDARLTLRVIFEALADGGTALNYVKAESLLWKDGKISGVRLQDTAHPASRPTEAKAKVVINATGAWADRLRTEIGMPPRIRPLRGSHLIFPAWRLPVAQAVSFLHPVDRRPVFIFPWEGVTLIGTTDVDHSETLDIETQISPQETAYLMAAVEAQFPTLEISLNDVISSFAGVRPVIGTGQADPSKESRDHIILEERGLVTVTGGKLTTFRLVAMDVLKTIRKQFPDLPPLSTDHPVLRQPEADLGGIAGLDAESKRRLLGRYGAAASDLVAAAQPGELERIPGTQTLWAELRWAAGAEGVIHLDDLLLRRVRLGLLLPQGGRDFLSRIRAVCQKELGWDNARWEEEERDYLALWQNHYSLPKWETIPNWHNALDRARLKREALLVSRQRRKTIIRSVAAAFLAGAAIIISYYFHLQRRQQK